MADRSLLFSGRQKQLEMPMLSTTVSEQQDLQSRRQSIIFVLVQAVNPEVRAGGGEGRGEERLVLEYGEISLILLL